MRIKISEPLIGEEEIKSVREVLLSGNLAQGEKVREFEEGFARFIGVRYAVATNSGTSAIHTALLAHGIGRGDEVITPAFTFASPINCILFCGARPVFVDINPESFNIDADKIEEKISRKTKAIVPTHLYGQPADMDKIMEIAEKNGLVVIEDACQAHGAEFRGKRVGSFGTGCFSFYATKNITTGEGGMITTDDEEIAMKARLLRNQGMDRRYHHKIIGYNYRMNEIQAAIGLEQLKRIEECNMRRIRNAEFLTENLLDIPNIVTPKVLPDRKHVFHAYTLRAKLGRDRIVSELNKKGVESLVYYPIPVYRQEAYADLHFDIHLPVTEKVSQEIFSVPVHPKLEKKDLDRIVSEIRTVVK